MDKQASAGQELPEALARLLPAYMARQRWYAGGGVPPTSLHCLASGQLVPPAGGGEGAGYRVLWALVEAGGDHYQLFIGERPTAELAEHISKADDAVVGSAGDRTFYDATVDPEMAVEILGALTGGAQTAKHARLVGAEQSNTSVVYDDRLILKFFRRVPPGPNLDAEVTTALAAAGFAHVAQPLVRWQRDGRDLAFGQQYLAGGTDGWALALTSLRDFYATSPEAGAADPARSGGDFAAEATRLGQVTAEMHIALAQSFGADHQYLAGAWPGWLDQLWSRVELLHPSLVEGAGPLFEALRSVEHPGPAIRAHGDYHLGQVMRTDAGWYVLDFEGEPGRPVEQRLQPTSALKDVAGMLRSFQYAAWSALGEHSHEQAGWLEPLALAWEQRNRQAFLRGYRGHPGTAALLPTGRRDFEAVRLAFELDKALYELSYEEAHRKAWVGLPLAALHRLLSSPVEQLLAEVPEDAGAVDDGEPASPLGPGRP